MKKPTYRELEKSIIELKKVLSEHKKAEESLQESELKYKGLSDSISDVFFAMDEDFKYTFWNKASEKLTGIKSENALGKTIFEIFGKTEQINSMVMIYRKVLKTGKPDSMIINFSIRKKDYIFDLSIYPIKEGVSVYARDITEQKRAEEALRKEREKAQEFLDISGVMMVAIDSEQKITMINKKGCQILGYKEEEILGNNWFDICLPATIRKGVKSVFNKLMKSEIESVEYFENPVITKSGQEKIIAWHNTVLRDEQGNITGTLSSGEDITERKKAEEALSKSEEKYRDLTNTLPLTIFETDTNGRLTFVNNHAFKIFGYTCNDFERGLNFINIIAPEDREKAIKNFQNRLNGEESEEKEYTLIRKDNSKFPAVLRSDVILHKNKPAGLRGFLVDISELKKAEKALQENEEKFRLIAETSFEDIWQLDLTGKVTYVSPAVETIFGHTPEEALTLGFNEFLAEPDHERATQAFMNAVNGQKYQLLELEGRRKDGSSIPIEVSITPIIRNESIIGVQGIARDITERKQTEKALKESLQTSADIVNAIPSGLVIFQIEKHNRLILLDVNPETTRLLGKRIVKWKGMELKDIWADAGKLGIVDAFLSVNKTGKIYEMEDLFYKDNEIEADFWIRAFPMPGERLGVAFENITERKKAEIALRESEEKFSKAFNASPLAIAINDINKSEYLEVNNAFEKLTGFSREEIIKKSPESLNLWINPDDERKIIKALEKHGSIHNKEICFRRKSGEIRYVLFSAELLKIGDEDKVISTALDITEKTEVEKALKESENRYRSLFENIPTGIYQTTPDGRILNANPALVKMLGYESLDELKKINLEKTNHNKRFDRTKFKNVLKEKGYFKGHEDVWLTKNNKKVHIRENAVAVYNDEKNILFYEGTVEDISAQKKAEEALKSSEAKLQSVLRSAPIGIGVVTDRKFDYINNRFCELTGFKKEELIGKSSEIVYPNKEEYKRVGEVKYKQIAEKGYGIVETKFKKKSGGFFDAFLSSSVIDPKDISKGVTFTAVDITDIKRMERELRKQNDFLNNIIESLTHPFYVINANDFSLEILNSAAKSFSDKEVATCHMLTHGFDKPCEGDDHLCPVKIIKKTKKPEKVEHVHLISDGTKKYFEIYGYPIFGKNGNVEKVIEYSLDITDRKIFEKALKEERSRLLLMLKYESLLSSIASQLNTSTHMFNALNDIVKIVERETGINTMKWCIFDNEYFKIIEKYEKEFYEKKDESDVIKPCEFEEIPEILQNMINCEELVSNDLQIFNENEENFFLKRGIGSCIMVPIKIEDQGIGALCFGQIEEYDWKPEMKNLCRTIADMVASVFQRHFHNYARLEAEKKEIEAIKIAERNSRLASLGTLAAGIAHEINQPLNALKVKVDGMIYYGGKDSEKLIRNLTGNLIHISEQADRIDEIIQQMKVLVKQGKGKIPEKLDINVTIKKAVFMVEQRLKSHSIKLDFNFHESNPKIEGHPTQVEQVFINLFINSINAFDKIYKKEKTIVISTDLVEKNCVIKVADNGPGIPESNINHIFDPFFTTKHDQEGMGLGLSIVQNIILGMGGTIDAGNNENAGAYFLITLPLAEINNLENKDENIIG